MLREPTRWSTHFGEWVTTRGVPQVAVELALRGAPVSPNAIYKWLAGRHVPRVEVALKLVEISEGQIALSDVYMQVYEIRALRAAANGESH